MRTSWAIAAASAVLIAAGSAGCTSSSLGNISRPAQGGSRLHVAQVGVIHPGRGRPVEVVRTSSPPANADEWEVVRLDPRSSSVHIQWSDGFSPECGQADQALVHETAHAIVIGLRSTFAGPGTNCAAFAVLRSRTIALRSPIGARALLEHLPEGVNADYSFVADPDRLPVPQHCLRGSAERNAPVGALDAAGRLVPFAPTRVLICPADPKAAHRVVTSPRALAALARDLNDGRLLPLDEHGFPASCPDDRSVFFDLYVSDASAVVQVHLGDRGCLAMSNGIRTTTVPDALTARLGRLTGSG